MEASRPDFYKIFYKNTVFFASYSSGYANGQSVKAVGGIGDVYGYSGSGVEFSKTLPPGTYYWSVNSKVEYWIAYTVTADGVTYANVAEYKGEAETHTGGTFTINHKFNASVYAHAYGYGVLCVSIYKV